MKIERKWCMPSKDTFSIKPIKDLMDGYVERLPENGVVIDPFVGLSPYKDICVSNDLNPEIKASCNMDALEFLKSCTTGICDLFFYDPPYSVRQVSECYKSLGMTVNMETTQSTFWSNLKKEIKRIVKQDGIVISFGWNSGGIGKTNGFKIEEILLVPHGGPHNDTIVTVERRV